MTEKKLPLSKLNGTKIYNSVAKGVLTLRQLAEGYDCSFEQFVAECKRVINPTEWRRIMRADERNQKIATNRKENSKMADKKLQQCNAKKRQILLEELQRVQEKAGISKTVTEDFEGRVEVLDKEVARLKKLLAEAESRLEWATKNLASSKKEDANYEERIRQIQAKLDEFNIYLVSPRFKGEMPRGKLISVVPFEGYNVTVEQGDDLLNDVSFASMLEMGFETLKEANMALEFAKLVLKYQVECDDEFKILVDDEKIIAILQEQEVEI